MHPFICLHPDDNVVIARTNLMADTTVADGVATTVRIPAGHKVVVRPITLGEPVRRYSQIIGFATTQEPRVRLTRRGEQIRFWL